MELTTKSSHVSVEQLASKLVLGYQACGLPIPDDVVESHRTAFVALLETGTWFTAQKRQVILQEIRRAQSCKLCLQRREAASPNWVRGEHDTAAELPQHLIEIIHRIATDSGRLTHKWFKAVTATANAQEYIEITGMLAILVILDSYARGLGMTPIEIDRLRFPTDTAEPTRETNAAVVDEGAWVPLMAVPKSEAQVTSGLPEVPNIVRAMGIVPLAVAQFFQIMRSHYGLQHMNSELSRPQIELIAARVSSYNDCFY
jgi:hypothetical protein